MGNICWICLWLFTCVCASICQRFHPKCNRIYFQRIIESNPSPSTPFDAVDEINFVKTKWTRNNAPLFKAERKSGRKSLFFFYNSRENIVIFSSRRYGYPFGYAKISSNKLTNRVFTQSHNTGASSLPLGTNFKTDFGTLDPVCVPGYSIRPEEGKILIRKRRAYLPHRYEKVRVAMIVVGCVLPFLLPFIHCCYSSKDKPCEVIFSKHFYVGESCGNIFLKPIAIFYIICNSPI